MRLAAFADEADKRLDGQIAALKRNGISRLEIRGVDGTNVSDLTAKQAKEVRERLDAAGITVWSVGSPIGKAEIADDFAPHYGKYLRTLETAAILGAGKIRIFSFYHTGIGFSDPLRDAVLERLERLLDGAKGSGITLCHENEKRIYGETAARCREIHEALPGLKAVFDPANFAECREDVLPAWEILKGYVSYLHVKDVAPDGTVVPAGEGICRMRELIADYRRNGGEALTVEPHLAVFDGLAALEKKDGRTAIAAFRYASSGEAFDAAVASLKRLIGEGEP